MNKSDVKDENRELRFTRSHEWVKLQGDGTALVGISDHAQSLLGDIVFIELPALGETVTLNDPVAVVESVKAASDVYTPMSGEITAVNEEVVISPEIINTDPQGGAWLFRLRLSDPAEWELLLAEDIYISEVA